MERKELLAKMYRDKLIDGYEISQEEFEELDENDDENIFQAYDENSENKTKYFQSTGITDDTKIEMQYRTYKCIRTIKNIMIAALVIAVIGMIISTAVSISSAHKAKEIADEASSYSWERD